MKGKMKETVRKWWVLVVVATLALSLTSCGMKRSSLMSGAGGVACNGDLGYFSVATFPIGNNEYELRITALEINDPGDIVDVALVYPDPYDYKVLVPETSLQPGKVLRLRISDVDLESYEYVSLTSATPGQIYAGANKEKANDCYLPFPGESDNWGY